MILNKKSNAFFRIFSAVLLVNFFTSFIIPPQFVNAQLSNQSTLNLPAPGKMLPLSGEFIPTMIQGITLDPKNPLLMDFIVDTGDEHLQGEDLKKEATKLVKYFLASLTVPEKELWVNLSPYEKGRIVSDSFGKTEMGRDLLAQDYMLKQLTASLMYPEEGLGSEFWKRVYSQVQAKFGKTEIPLNTFNKIWIIPEKAVVIQQGTSVYVIESHLKVMLEEDYLALEINRDKKNTGPDAVNEEKEKFVTGMVSDAVREVLIPEIEKEVNTGKTFANLRQIYNSMILATWYKKNLKQSLLGQVYVNKNKTTGVNLKDTKETEEIYNRYVDAFKTGVYDYIKEDYDPVAQELVSRKYFSGGIDNKLLPKVSQDLNVQDEDYTNLTPPQKAGLERVKKVGEKYKISTEIKGIGEKKDNKNDIENDNGLDKENNSEGDDSGDNAMLVEVKSIISSVSLLSEQLKAISEEPEKNEALNDSLLRRTSVLNHLSTELAKKKVSATEAQSLLVNAVSDLDAVMDIKLREDISRILAKFVNNRAKKGYGEKDTEALKEKRLAQLAALREVGKVEGADISGLPTVEAFVAEALDLNKPDRVIVVNASDPKQIAELKEKGLDEEIIFEGLDGNYGSYSHVDDTARAIGPTKNTSRDPKDKGHFNNWADSEEALIKMLAKSIGQYKGKTMYVLATVAGDPEDSTSFGIIQSTDNLSIVFQYLHLYNFDDNLVGQKALDKIRKDDGQFMPIYHATGDLDYVRRADDLVIEHESGSFTKLNKTRAVIIYKKGKPVLVNLPNENGKLESADLETKDKNGESRIDSLLALNHGKKFDGTYLNRWYSARKITDDTEDRSFVYFTNSHDGSHDFVDQYGSEIVRLIYSAYGGNGIGAKKFFLRMLSFLAMKTKSFGIVHAYLIKLRNKKTGETFGFMGEFPSQVGKTNAALGEIANLLADEWEIIYFGDDIGVESYHVIDADGNSINAENAPLDQKFHAVFVWNPESGWFGVAPGMSHKELKLGLEAIEKGGALSINLAYRFFRDKKTGRLKFEDGDMWWEGLDKWKDIAKPLPATEIVQEFFLARDGNLAEKIGWHDWKRKPLHARLKGIIPKDFNTNLEEKDKEKNELIEDINRLQSAKEGETVELVHPDLAKAVLNAFIGPGKELAQLNSRISVPNKNVSTYSKGSVRVNLSEISGKRPNTQALVRLVLDPVAGEYERLLNSSEGTAAEEKGRGVAQEDPGAMKPFMAGRLGKWAKDRLNKALRLVKGERIVSVVNPFLKKPDPRNPDKEIYIWPGFKENSRFRVWEAVSYKRINELISKNAGLLDDNKALQEKLDELYPKEYQVTTLGILPTPNSKIFDRMKISFEDRQRLTSINADEYRAEIIRNTNVMLNKWDMDVPDEIRREHERRAFEFNVILPQAWYAAKSWTDMQKERDSSDVAMLGDLENPKVNISQEQEEVGGINLNPEYLDLEFKRDDNGIPLPIFNQPIQNMTINGFIPVIINVTPIVTPLSIKMRDQDEPQKKAQQPKVEPMALLNNKYERSIQ